MTRFSRRIVLVATASLLFWSSPVFAGDDSGTGGSSGGSSGGASGGGSSAGDTSGGDKAGATDSSGDTSGVPASSSSSSSLTAGEPASTAPSPVPVIEAGTEVTPDCPTCAQNWNVDNTTTAGSHDPVLWSNGSLVDSATGRPAYFGPDGQAAWSAPQPGTSSYVMPDGRTAYYLPATGGDTGSFSVPALPTIDSGWSTVGSSPPSSSSSSSSSSPSSSSSCPGLVSSGFARPDGTCAPPIGPVLPT